MWMIRKNDVLGPGFGANLEVVEWIQKNKMEEMTKKTYCHLNLTFRILYLLQKLSIVGAYCTHLFYSI